MPVGDDVLDRLARFPDRPSGPRPAQLFDGAVLVVYGCCRIDQDDALARLIWFDAAAPEEPEYAEYKADYPGHKQRNGGDLLSG